jgi:Mg/Co/Ni transporter MgtE
MSAWQLMSTHPICFDFLPELLDISCQLQNTKFNGFPVLNGKRQLIGIIERDLLIALIKKECWYDPEASSSQKDGNEESPVIQSLHTAINSDSHA